MAGACLEWKVVAKSVAHCGVSPILPSPEEADAKPTRGIVSYTRPMPMPTRSFQGPDQAFLEGTIIGASGEFTWVVTDLASLNIIATCEVKSVGSNGRIPVFVRGMDPDEIGLVSVSASTPVTDWSCLRRALANTSVLLGTVEDLVKGGLRVSLGGPVDAFLPASRSGALSNSEMEELVGQTILCTVVEVDEADENIVVDRRRILEAADSWSQERIIERLQVGSRVRGIVSTITDFGAFVDIGGVDGLLHVKDISWKHIERPSEVLKLGQEVEVLIERIEPQRGRVALSMKALEPDPWAGVEQRFRVGDRIKGRITTVTNFGAFVELEPGLEGLVHISDLSWSKKRPTVSDLAAAGDSGEFVILSVDERQRRIALSRKRAVGDPWTDIGQQFPVGSITTGTITGLTDFGAFVRLTDDVEGMVHVGDICEHHIEHPRDLLSLGQEVRAHVLEVDCVRRRLRLGLRDAQETVASSRKSSGEAPKYSSTIFVNCPTGSAQRIVTDAILFAVIHAGFLPRMRLGPASMSELMSAVRESHFGIHDLSQPFELGVFIGCKEFGPELHQAKEFLLLSAADVPESAMQVLAHYNDPTEAIRQVSPWLAQRRGRPFVWQDTVNRYRQFREYLSGLTPQNETGRLPIPELISAARAWIDTRQAIALVSHSGRN